MSEGYVYILTNEAMPGLVKIGKTTRSVEQRANELYQTGVPQPFTIAFKMLLPDCHQAEQWVHHRLASHRLTESREFFRCEMQAAMLAIENAHSEQVSVWLDRYKPDCELVEVDAVVDIGFLYEKISRPDLCWMDVSQILDEVTAEDLEPAIARMIARRLARRDAATEVSGDALSEAIIGGPIQ